MNLLLQAEAINFREYCEKISSGVLLTDRKIAEIIQSAMEYANGTKELIKVFDKVGFSHRYSVDRLGDIAKTHFTVIEGVQRNGLQTIDFLRSITINYTTLST